MRRAVVLILASTCLAGCATGGAGGGSEFSRSNDLTPSLAAHARGDVDATLSALQPLLDEEPWHVGAHRLRQDALRAGGRDGEAVAFYAREAAAAPDDPRRALLASRTTTREDGARLAAYRRALAMDPDGGWTRAALAAELLNVAADLAAAATARRDAGYPDDAAALDAQHDAHLVEAVALADAAVAAHADLAAAHAAQAAALAARSETDAAERAGLLKLAVTAQERAVHLSPGDARPVARLAVMRRRAGDDVRAAEAYREALALDPGDPALQAGLGRTLLDRGEFEAATGAFEAAVEARPGDALLLLDLGVARQRTGDLEGAIESLRQAAALLPEEPRPLRALLLVMDERERGAAGGPDSDP